MKKKKYLPLYYKWMKTGRMPQKKNYVFAGGLCSTPQLNDDPCLALFEPLGFATYHWGFNGAEFSTIDLTGIKDQDLKYSFTPFRQTVVLFMAAINGEKL